MSRWQDSEGQVIGISDRRPKPTMQEVINLEELGSMREQPFTEDLHASVGIRVDY